MAKEDGTTYTKVDPGGFLTMEAAKATGASVPRNQDCYSYKDFGADYFDDLDVTFLIYLTQSNDNCWAGGPCLANTIGAIDDFGSTDLSVTIFDVPASLDYRLYLMRGDDVASDYFPFYPTIAYYCTLKRTAGSDTVTLEIYDDEARTNLVDTLTVSGFGTVKYRYSYYFANYNDGLAGRVWGGRVENLDFGFVLLPTVTTQPVTDIVTTAATGHGTIVDLGLSSVTEHGFVVDTTIDPKTAGDGGSPVVETTLGDGSLGTFTSSITGLTAGTKYYFRAYATNSDGPAYGNNISFIAGSGWTQLKPYIIGVVQTRFHYVDADGKERYLEGTLV